MDSNRITLIIKRMVKSFIHSKTSTVKFGMDKWFLCDLPNHNVPGQFNGTREILLNSVIEAIM